MSEEVEEILPSELTTMHAAASVLSALSDMWQLMNLGDSHDFFAHTFKTIWAEEDLDGDKKAELIKTAENMTEWEGEPLVPGFKASLLQVAVGVTSCAFAVQALKAEKDSREAWCYVIRATRFLGLLQGFFCGRDMERGIDAVKFSQAGLDARHSENRKMKVDVFSWCDDNMSHYKSMDSAAEAIAGKVVPVTFRTARAWISDWKKKNQSAGRL